jgi:hypothetical protein
MLSSSVEAREAQEGQKGQDRVYNQEADNLEGVDEVALVDTLENLEGARKVVLDDIVAADQEGDLAEDLEVVQKSHTAAAVVGNAKVETAVGDLVGGVQAREACNGQEDRAGRAGQAHQEVGHNTAAVRKVAVHMVGEVLVGQEVDRNFHTLVGEEVGNSVHVQVG